MVLSFLFSKSQKEKDSNPKDYSEIKKNLILFRFKSTNQSSIDYFTALLKHDNFAKLKEFILLLTFKIIDEEHGGNEEKKQRFNFAMDHIIQNAMSNELYIPIVIRFSNDLLQLSTILCELKQSTEISNLTQFKDFLLKNKEIFGDYTKNPLVLEYLYTFAFNDAALICDSLDMKIAPIPNIEEKTSELIKEVKILYELVQKSITSSDFDIYNKYLEFVANYTLIKITECIGLIERGKTTSEEFLEQPEVVRLKFLQEEFIKKTDLILNSIKSHLKEAADSSKIQGNCYLLGNKLFERLPYISDIDTVIDHVEKLAPNPSFRK